MDLSDVLHLLSSSGLEAVEFVHTNFDPVKAATILFAALSALTGIYIKWRNSGYRQVARLHEFLDNQETRVTNGRAALSSLFTLPHPNDREQHPSFCSKKLGRSLREMNWGYGMASPRDLPDAIVTTAKQAELAIRTADEHRKRQALAHLLQGARLASRAVGDDLLRSRARTEALEHFRSALKIDPTDADALEYALMMMLELANPQGVLNEINDLIHLRAKPGGMALVRAHRINALAYERMPVRQLSSANSAMIAGLPHLPENAVLDKAIFHEHHGMIRMQANMLGVANQSFQLALMCYQHLANTNEGKAGVSRVATYIANLNTAAGRDGNAPLPLPTAPPARNMLSFTRLSKQND